MSSFSQHDKPITSEQNVIDFDGYFIYGSRFMNRQWAIPEKKGNRGRGGEAGGVEYMEFPVVSKK